MPPRLAKACPYQSTTVTISTPTTRTRRGTLHPHRSGQSDLASHSRTQRRRKRNTGPHLRSKTVNTIKTPQPSQPWTTTNPTSTDPARSTHTRRPPPHQQHEKPQSPSLKASLEPKPLPGNSPISQTSPSTQPLTRTLPRPAPQPNCTSRGRPAVSTQPTSPPGASRTRRHQSLKSSRTGRRGPVLSTPERCRERLWLVRSR